MVEVPDDQDDSGPSKYKSSLSEGETFRTSWTPSFQNLDVGVGRLFYIIYIPSR